MANYTMVVEDKEPKPGKPKYVFIWMRDVWYEATNTWVINQPNNWLGIGKGEYKVVGWNYDALEFRDAEGTLRMVFRSIKYPGDCEPSSGKIKTGIGVYDSPYKFAGSGYKLEWSARNIVPEP